VWKRSKLPVADRPGLRPTPDRVRETLFNWLGQDLSGWRCLDAFAGSGALGFEAASRGAAEVVLLERDPAWWRCWRRQGSPRRRGDPDRAQRRPAVDGPGRRGRLRAGLLDPPFDSSAALPAMAAAARLVVPGGFVYVEAPTAIDGEPVAAAGLEPWRAGRAGNVHFHLFRRPRPAERRGYTAPEFGGPGRRRDFSDPTDCRVSRHLRPDDLGHEDLMRRASRLFERLIVAVAAGHHKRTMFSVGERLQIATELSNPYPNVEVMEFRGLLRDFVVEQGGKVVVRGLRAVSDFEYEFQMAGMNRQLMPDVENRVHDAERPVPVRFRHFRAGDRQPGRRRFQIRVTLGAGPPARPGEASRGLSPRMRWP
jgi:pantetheine-phosphate adenylyltransferase